MLVSAIGLYGEGDLRIADARFRWSRRSVFDGDYAERTPGGALPSISLDGCGRRKASRRRRGRRPASATSRDTQRRATAILCRPAARDTHRQSMIDRCGHPCQPGIDVEPLVAGSGKQSRSIRGLDEPPRNGRPLRGQRLAASAPPTAGIESAASTLSPHALPRPPSARNPHRPSHALSARASARQAHRRTAVRARPGCARAGAAGAIAASAIAAGTSRRISPAVQAVCDPSLPTVNEEWPAHRR